MLFGAMKDLGFDAQGVTRTCMFTTLLNKVKLEPLYEYFDYARYDWRKWKEYKKQDRELSCRFTSFHKIPPLLCILAEFYSSVSVVSSVHVSYHVIPSLSVYFSHSRISILSLCLSLYKSITSCLWNSLSLPVCLWHSSSTPCYKHISVRLRVELSQHNYKILLKFICSL